MAAIPVDEIARARVLKQLREVRCSFEQWLERWLQWRYATWAQALAGHQRAAAMARAGRFEE